MNYLRRQKISILLIMSLGFAVLGTVIYVFMQTFSLIDEAKGIRTARDVSRKILTVSIVYYHTQSDIFRYYLIPNEYNLLHINSSVTNLGKAWNDFSLIVGQNHGDIYDGAENDIAALADDMKKFAAANNDCLNGYVDELADDNSKALEDVRNCIERIPQDEFNDEVGNFSDRQIRFIDNKNAGMIDDFIRLGMVMLFLLVSYVILLVVIVFWLKSLAGFLKKHSVKK